mgnify:CR=1 FL=1
MKPKGVEFMDEMILVINGPNLNRLGHRDPSQYGQISLEAIEKSLDDRSLELGVQIEFYQSNHEGVLVDFIQEHTSSANGIIINLGALTQTSYSILDALIDAKLPFVEVHLSNIHGREKFRQKSVLASTANGQIAGLGWRGYLYALDYLVALAVEDRTD